MQTITSATNPKIKQVVRLQQQSRQRRVEQAFCVESERELLRALEAGCHVQQLFVCTQRIASPQWLDTMRQAGAQVFDVTESVLEKIAYRQNPQGFVAVLDQRRASLDELRPDGLLVVCSGLEKPGNIGAILRSADAAGAAGVLIDDPRFDLYNSNCIRASTGAVFTLPIVCEERAVLMDWLKESGVRLVAATPEAGSSPAEADLTGPVAMVLGSEAEGLDETWKQAADQCVALSMRGTVDSLNVSATAAVLLYEALRQRDINLTPP